MSRRRAYTDMEPEQQREPRASFGRHGLARSSWRYTSESGHPAMSSEQTGCRCTDPSTPCRIFRTGLGMPDLPVGRC